MLQEGSHRRLLDSVAESPLAMVLSNPREPDNPLRIVNPAFCALTGYREEEIVGRNCRFLAGPGTEAAVSESIRQAIHARRPILAEILNYRSDGSMFRNGVMITPLFGDDENVEWFLGSQVALVEEDAGLAGRRERALARVSALPERQRQVLGLVARGLLNKQIAHALKISEKTVKMHRGLMLDRLGVRTSAEAIRLAVEAGL